MYQFEFLKDPIDANLLRAVSEKSYLRRYFSQTFPMFYFKEVHFPYQRPQHLSMYFEMIIFRFTL